MNPKTLTIIYVIIAIFFVGLFINSYFTVSCRISVSDNEIIQGNNVNLVYEIDNKLILDDINNIDFEYWVVQGDKLVISKDIAEIEKISRLDKHIGSVEIELSSLEKGKYTIWTQTTYSVGQGGTGIGNRESKMLSINIYII